LRKFIKFIKFVKYLKFIKCAKVLVNWLLIIQYLEYIFLFFILISIINILYIFNMKSPSYLFINYAIIYTLVLLCTLNTLVLSFMDLPDNRSNWTLRTLINVRYRLSILICVFNIFTLKCN
jgi:hypothetical protein